MRENIMEELLKETPILNYSHFLIKNLIEQRKWNELSDVEKVKKIYNFVRDEIKFGYNTGDMIPASDVLKDGSVHDKNR